MVKNAELTENFFKAEREATEKEIVLNDLREKLDKTENILVRDLKETAEVYNTEKNFLKNDVNSLQDRIRSYQDSEMKHEYDLKVLLIENDSEKKLNASLQKDKENLAAEMRNLRDSLEMLRNSSAGLESDKINLQYDNKILQGELETEKRNCEKLTALLENQNCDYQNQKTLLESEKAKLQAEQNRCFAVESDLKILIEQNEGKKNQILQLDAELEKYM